MFPGRFPNVPDTMWNFGWNPQTMGLQGQLCGGDMMNQQSQAQSQAQTQAQIAALREQNAILNQQLTSQAQSHIQHLQQLIPFHQPTQQAHATSTPPTPQPSGPQVPDPPTPVVPQTSQAGPNPSFNPEEMMQQMKHTVESSIQAFVDKTQERNTNQPPAPAHPPTPTYPHNISHSHPLGEYSTSSRRSQRRSRPHRHRSLSRRHDKRPVSIPRSPRRRRSTRRVRRSSRPRSSSREFSTSRHASRQPSRATSITLRSASPQCREGRHRVQDHQSPRENTNPPATLQPASWDYYPQQSSQNTNTQSQSYHYGQSSTNKWQPWGQWKDDSNSSNSSNPSKWIGYSKPSAIYNDPYDCSTKPLTAFSSDHTTSHHQKKKPPNTPGSDQSHAPVNVPPGHVAINLQEGSKEEWFRSIKYALNHPERMGAANEIALGDRPQPSQTMDHQAYEQACETLKKVDSRIPRMLSKKRSSCSSAHTSFLTMILHKHRSENFLPPT